ncbi:hypothetical protein ABZY33_30905, partial [Streptomyces sp. NPDC006552]
SRIAERVGLSQMHVSRLITRSCAQVRACADPACPHTFVPLRAAGSTAAPLMGDRGCTRAYRTVDRGRLSVCGW